MIPFQILQGCPGVKPAEVVTDFIHNSHQHFRAGVFWVNCKCQELVMASCNYIEKVRRGEREGGGGGSLALPKKQGGKGLVPYFLDPTIRCRP